MKKLILLALVALVAGAAFAETAPAFTGDFEYRTQMNFDTKDYAADDTEGEANINLNGVVDEWSFVDAKLEAGGGGGNVTITEFALTTDVTGALGVSGPVGVTIKWGAITAEAAEYQGVAGYADIEVTDETDTYLGLALTLGLGEKVNFIATVFPSTYLSDDWNIEAKGVTKGPYNSAYGFELQFLGLTEGLDFNLFYTSDQNTIDDGAIADWDSFNEFGLTLGYTSDMVNLGLAFRGETTGDDVYSAGISANRMFGPLTVGLAFRMPDLGDFNNSKVGFNLTAAVVPDVMDVFGAVDLPFSNFADTIAVDAGAKFFLGATTYVIGYDWRGAEFEGPGIADGDNDPDTSNGQGLYLKVKASF